MSNPEQSPGSSWVKNKASFYFKIDRQNGVTTGDPYSFASGDKQVQVFLNGVIYNQSGEQLVQGFLTQGLDYVSALEGSFIIFLIVGTQFHIITDKVNSKKAFYALLDHTWYVSNNIDALPKQKCQLDMTGLACYLANGYMLNDLTLFQEIRSARRASVHSITNGEMSTRRYWDCRFEYSGSPNIPEQRYQEELESLIVDSIKRRLVVTSEPAISLSGGYDSRAILGILHNILKASNISCFSYALTKNPIPDSDADLARKMAGLCGYPHQMLESYNGNLIEHLIANAREGKCLSQYSQEVDAWHSLAESHQYSDLFIGDIWFGLGRTALETKEDILGRVRIRGASGIGWLGHSISKDVYRQLCRYLDQLTDGIFETTQPFHDPQDKIDFLYLDQRMDHVLQSKEENFSSQAGFVHTPFLDGKILDFIKKMPPHLRNNKQLYKSVLFKLLPEFYSMERAKFKYHTPDWKQELRKHKDLLISLVQGTDSRLDEIIPRREILTALELKVSLIQKVQAFLAKALVSIRLRSRFAERLLGIFLGPRVKPSLPPDWLLMRLLVIWIYLSPPASGE